MIVVFLLSSAFIGTLTNAFRFYQNNDANIECPISAAKPNLDVDRVSGRWLTINKLKIILMFV